jgi:hypothetical protein
MTRPRPSACRVVVLAHPRGRRTRRVLCGRRGLGGRARLCGGSWPPTDGGGGERPLGRAPSVRVDAGQAPGRPPLRAGAPDGRRPVGGPGGRAGALWGGRGGGGSGVVGDKAGALGHAHWSMRHSHPRVINTHWEKKRGETMAKSPHIRAGMRGFYLVFQRQNEPQARGTRPTRLAPPWACHPLLGRGCAPTLGA